LSLKSSGFCVITRDTPGTLSLEVKWPSNDDDHYQFWI